MLAGRTTMELGASIFFTEYSITPTELAPALEERGFDSLWVAEHSHIPVTHRSSPPGTSGGVGAAVLRRDGPVRDAERGGSVLIAANSASPNGSLPRRSPMHP